MTSPVMVMSTIIWWMFWAWLVHPTIVRAAAVAKTTHSNDTFASTGVEEHQSYPGGLYWNDLSVRTDDDGAFLVHNCRGMVFDGHLCAILGPSGAGKSTFLHALAGAVSSASHLNVRGDIFLYDADHQTRERLQIDGGHIGWLSQHDHFFTLMTVKETLDLAAFLQLPTFSKRQRQRRVKSILTSLGLKDLQHRRVGESSNQRSLSGGEKRRLSLAIELVSQTKLFFGDEPTSGLDSSMAFKVVRLIKKVIQQKNIPCILTLHQPQSSIFKLLDSLILLAPGGRVCYMGPSNKAVQYFAKLGYPCPTQTNPAEYLLDLVSIDSDDPRQASEDELRISRLASAFADEKTRMRVGEDPSLSTMLAPTSFLPVLSPFRESGSGTDAISQMVEDISIHQHTHKEAKHMTSFASNSYRVVQRFGKLLLRSWRQNYRNHKVNLIRLVAAIGNAFLFSRIFQSIKIGLFTSRSVADRVALLTFAVINMSMLSLMKTVSLFANEKPVVLREQQRKQYTSLEYLFAKVLAEIPLDTVFAAVFTTSLKSMTGLRISWEALTGVFSLMTVAGASLGFAIGSLSPTGDVAMTAAMPVMIILMMVGVINPSGVDPDEKSSAVVQGLQHISPIAYAIKAVCVAEYRGGKFDHPLSTGGQSSSRFGRWNIFGRSKQLLKDLPKMGALALVQNGDQVLSELGLGDESYASAMNHLAVIAAGNLLLSWIGLQLQAKSTSSSSSSSSSSLSSQIEE